MQLQAAWGKIGIGVSLFVALTGIAQASDDYSCMQLMYEHGLATSAQLNCGYETYNNAIIEEASECLALAESVGRDVEFENVLKAGVTDFQTQYDESSNKQRICAAFANEFDFIVRP